MRALSSNDATAPTAPAKNAPAPNHPHRRAGARLSLPEISLLMLAFSGWLVLIANLFGLAGRTGWIFPVVTDIPGLAISTLALALLGATPLFIRLAIRGRNPRPSR